MGFRLPGWRRRARALERTAEYHEFDVLPVWPYALIVTEPADAGWRWPHPDAHRAPVSAFEALCGIQAAARRYRLL